MSSSPPPLSPSTPNSLFAYAFTISDTQIITSLVLSIMSGLAVLVVYPIIRQPFSCYQKRMEIIDLVWRARPIFVHGFWKKLWAHFVPVFLVYEEEILLTAGLDAFLLLRTMVLGIQLFLPLSVFGCLTLLPMALSGKNVDAQAASGTAVASSLMYYSMANVEPGSGLFVMYLVVVLCFFGYTYWLLLLHYRSINIMRSKYLTQHRPLRDPGDYGVMHLIGLGNGKLTSKERFIRVCREVLSPVFMFSQTLANDPLIKIPSSLEGKEKNETKMRGRVKPLPPDFISHQATWSDHDPLKSSDGKISPVALFPWWAEINEQPPAVHDDTSMIFVGKSVVEMRQLVPALTSSAKLEARPDIKVLIENYTVLIQCNQAPGFPSFPSSTSTSLSSLVPFGLSSPGGYFYKRARTVSDVEVPKPLSSHDDTQLKSASLAQAEELYQSYSQRFPDTFQALVPVYNHEHVDALLVKLDAAMGAVESAMAKLDLESKGGKHPSASDLKKLEEELPEMKRSVERLEAEVIKAREDALGNPRGVSFFAIFSSKQDAHIASTCPPVGTHLSGLWSYHVAKAPSPDDINWQSLWTPFFERQWRGLVMLIPLYLSILFPIGILTGTLTNIHLACCSGTPDTNAFYLPGLCDASSTGFWSRLVKDLITGVLPTIINTFFDTYVMPLVFFFITQAERSSVSLSSQDRKVASYFLIYDIINGFLMVVFSSGIISQVGNIIKKAENRHVDTSHSSFISNVANGLSGSCNFFFNNIMWKAFFTNLFRFTWPHDGTVIFVLLRAVGLHLPHCSRDKAVIRGTPGFRGGRHFGALFIVFIPGLCYGVINPIILPLCLAYFVTCLSLVNMHHQAADDLARKPPSDIAWKYSILYFYERSQESGGQMIEVVMASLFDTLKLAAIFTGATLLSLKAWWCGAIVLVVLPITTVWFEHTIKRFQSDLNLPLEFVDDSPAAVVNPLAYLPTGLRNGALGWFPDGQRVWEKYGVPRYV